MSIVTNAEIVNRPQGINGLREISIDVQTIQSLQGGYKGSFALFQDPMDVNSIIVMVGVTQAMIVMEPKNNRDGSNNDVINTPYRLQAGVNNINYNSGIYVKLSTSMNPWGPMSAWEIFFNLDLEVNDKDSDINQSKYKFTKTSTRPI